MPDIVQENRSIKIVDPQNPRAPFQRKVRLSQEKRDEVKRDLEKIYEGWLNSYNLLKSQMQRWLANSEGISDAVDFPWTGASNIVKPIIEIRQNIIHAFFMSVIRPMISRLFICVADNYASPEEQNLAKDLTAFFNSNRKFNMMYVQSVSEAFWSVLVDGTVGRSVNWVVDIVKKWEIKTYENLNEFLEKYPTPESANLSSDEYLNFISRLQNGETLKLDEEFDFPENDDPEIGVIPLKDIVIYPMSISNQKRSRFLGTRFWLRKSEIKKKEKEKIYDYVDEVLSHEPSKGADQIASFQNSIEGISVPEKKEDYEIIHGLYKNDLDEDGIEEKYLVTYVPETKSILQIDKYPFYHGDDFIKLSWFKKRVNRILGRGVAQMLEDLHIEAGIQARHRINSKAIVNSPQFKADETLKDRLDPLRPENKVRPGGFWFLPGNMLEKVKAVDMPEQDLGESDREEALIAQTADNLVGASELRSGRETPFDPRAPAAKTAILLNQSSIRLDDFVFGFILKENECLDLVLKLYYQFGPEKLKFNINDNNQSIEKEIEKSKLNTNNIHLQLTVTSLIDNPDYLKNRWEEFYAKYAPEPMLGAIPEVRWEILNQIILNTPEAQGKKILLPIEQIRSLMETQTPPPNVPQPNVPPQQNGSQITNPTLKKALNLGGAT